MRNMMENNLENQIEDIEADVNDARDYEIDVENSDSAVMQRAFQHTKLETPLKEIGANEGLVKLIEAFGEAMKAGANEKNGENAQAEHGAENASGKFQAVQGFRLACKLSETDEEETILVDIPAEKFAVFVEDIEVLFENNVLATMPPASTVLNMIYLAWNLVNGADKAQVMALFSSVWDLCENNARAMGKLGEQIGEIKGAEYAIAAENTPVAAATVPPEFVEVKEI